MTQSGRETGNYSMGFWSDFGKGVSSHVDGIKFVAKHNLWHFFIYPVLILIVLFIAGYWSILGLADWIVDGTLEYYGLTDTGNTEDWTGILALVGRLLVGIILKVFFLMILTSYIKYVVLIVCSPILALLSERVDEIINNKKYPFNFGQFLHDMLRGILVTLRNMAFETLIILACLVIGWIPVIGWLTVPFLYLIAWYFLGFAMMDYTYERMRFSISEGARFTRRHKGIAIGNGFIFSMILLLPVIGVIIAPILSVVAATLAVLQVKNEEAVKGQHLAGQGMIQQ
jgi:CysZ protein